MRLSKFLTTALNIASFALIPSAQGGQSGNVTISGNVPVTTSITVTAAAGATSLDLSTTARNQVVATVNEVSNAPSGYKVTMASANSGQLKNGSAEALSYTAQYNGQNVDLSRDGTTVTETGSTSTPVNASKNLAISYTGQSAGSMVAGTYSDTLTFTITAN